MKLDYIIRGVYDAVKLDMKSTLHDYKKPREILNTLFWLMIIELFLLKFLWVYITLSLYIIVYIWKIIKQGDWKNKMREEKKDELLGNGRQI